MGEAALVRPLRSRPRKAHATDVSTTLARFRHDFRARAGRNGRRRFARQRPAAPGMCAEPASADRGGARRPDRRGEVPSGEAPLRPSGQRAVRTDLLGGGVLHHPHRTGHHEGLLRGDRRVDRIRSDADRARQRGEPQDPTASRCPRQSRRLRARRHQPRLPARGGGGDRPAPRGRGAAGVGGLHEGPSAPRGRRRGRGAGDLLPRFDDRQLHPRRGP